MNKVAIIAAILLAVFTVSALAGGGLKFKGSHSGNDVTLTQLPDGSWEVTIIRSDTEPPHLPETEEVWRSDSDTHYGWLGANVMIFQDKETGEWTICYLPGFPTASERLDPVTPVD